MTEPQDQVESSASLSVSFEQTESDVRDFVRYTLYRLSPGKYVLLVLRIVGLVVVLAFVIRLQANGPLMQGLRVLLLAGLGLLAWAIPRWLLELGIAWNPNPGGGIRRVGTVDGKSRSVLTGLSHQHESGSGEVPWKAIDRIDSTPIGVYFFTRGKAAFLVPSHAFGDSAGMKRFEELAENF